MIAALDKSIHDSGLLRYVRLLILAGDVFDRLLSLDDGNVQLIDRWIVRLLKACKKNGVILRVLEGTPSHDRNQSVRFETLHSLITEEDGDLNFRYVDKVSIEYIEDLKSHVLYIPDEAHHTTGETQRVVAATLAAAGLVEVDIAVIHGFFAYQLPYQTNEGSYHDPDYYHDIVRKWLTVGHIHHRSQQGKILVQGSHDRLNHAEEEDKGYVIATMGNRRDEAMFINNNDAHQYRSVELYGLDIQESLALIDKEAGKLGANANFRIVTEPGDPILTHLANIRVQWPHLVITHKAKSLGEKSIAEKVLENVIAKWVPIRIDKSNIPEIMAERILERGHDSVRRKRIIDRLTECL